jgi:hypothetical protein
MTASFSDTQTWRTIWPAEATDSELGRTEMTAMAAWSPSIWPRPARIHLNLAVTKQLGIACAESCLLASVGGRLAARQNSGKCRG